MIKVFKKGFGLCPVALATGHKLPPLRNPKTLVILTLLILVRPFLFLFQFTFRKI